MAKRTPHSNRLVLLSVAFLWAVALWFYASEEMAIERDLNTYVSFRAPDERILKIVDPRPGTDRRTVSVTVTVRGPRGEVYAVSGEDVRYHKPLDPDLPPEPVSVSLSPSDFHIPEHPELRVTRVRPASVKILLTEAGRKVVPVRVIPVGEPQKGYVLSTRPRTIPDNVEVRSSPEILEQVTFIETEPVDVGGAARSLSVMASLVNKVDISGTERSLILAQDQVVVLMDIAPAPVEVIKEHVPVRTLVPAGANFRVIPERGTVSPAIRGPEERIASLRIEDIKVFLDASSLEQIPVEGVASFPVSVVLPEGLEFVPESVPKEIKARVE